MIRRDEKTIKATLQLLGDQDFEVFLDWLEAIKLAESEKLMAQGDGFSLAQAQGRLQQITEIVREIKATPEVANKLKGRTVNVTSL